MADERGVEMGATPPSTVSTSVGVGTHVRPSADQSVTAVPCVALVIVSPPATYPVALPRRSLRTNPLGNMPSGSVRQWTPSVDVAT
jgi:hypothetical protein